MSTVCSKCFGTGDGEVLASDLDTAGVPFAIKATCKHCNGTKREPEPFIPAVEHPANREPGAFLVDRGDGVMVEDASAMCAGVHENGYDTLADLVAAQGWEREAAMIEAERAAYWASDAGQMRMSD